MVNENRNANNGNSDKEIEIIITYNNANDDYMGGRGPVSPARAGIFEMIVEAK